MYELENIYRDYYSLLCKLEIKYGSKIPIHHFILEVKKLYPFGKNAILKYLELFLNKQIQSNQRYLNFKRKRKYESNRIGNNISRFIIIEGLYFLLKNKKYSISKADLYNFFLINNQIEYSYEKFDKELSEIKIFRKSFFINRKLLDNLINKYNVNRNSLYNKSYILERIKNEL